MQFTLANLLVMARDTVLAPRAGAMAIMQMHLAPAVGWMALMLMAVLSAILTHLSFAMLPADAQAYMGSAMTSPVRTAILQWAVMLVSVHAIHRLGRWAGGHGTLANAVVLTAWLQFILLCFQIAQILSQILLPPLAEILGYVAVGLFFWLMTNFVAALHGFTSLVRVFFCILAALVVAGMLLGILITMLFSVPM